MAGNPVGTRRLHFCNPHRNAYSKRVRTNGCLLMDSNRHRPTLAVLVFSSAALGAFHIRMGIGETDLARYRDYGYNVPVIGEITTLATYVQIAPGALPAGAPLRVRIEENRRQLREKIQRATPRRTHRLDHQTPRNLHPQHATPDQRNPQSRRG